MADKQAHGFLAHNAAFRQRLVAGDSVFGAFVKTPHGANVEVLAQTGLDFLVLDGEHAPFDRAAIDNCILAGMAYQCPILVRIPSARLDWIMTSLDAGAAGIVAPRVASVEAARELVGMMTYQGGQRGFSPSPRAGEYSARSISSQLSLASMETILICQIEDSAGIDAAASIAMVEGVDALFLGPADLAVSMNLTAADDARVSKLCRETIIAVRPHAPIGLFVADGAAADTWQETGACVFIAGSDHSILLKGVEAILQK